MFLNPDVIATATNCLDRKHGALLDPRSGAGPVVLPPDRLARVRQYIADNS